MLSVVRQIFLFLSIAERLSAACFNALTIHGGHLLITYAALFMLMPGSEESFATLRTVRGKVIGITVPIMGHQLSPNL